MNNQKTAISYRPDIDGLRAFAVLSVVGFHAFPSIIKGGFIGVDVFFVISGYLISWIIIRDLQQNEFSFWDFYSRRIRRIFPALIVVLVAVLAFGWFALFADEYKILGKHVFGGTTFIANLVLWQEAGYFDVSAKAKPLLHLWSLGIEEQFYIFFPLLLWCSAKKHFRAAFIILTLGLLSFLDNIYLYRIDKTAVFYSPLTRIWELLAGSALSSAMRLSSTQGLYLRLDAMCAKLLYDTPQDNDGHSLSCCMAIMGTVLLALALLLAREDSAYPGWKALLPVLGAVCFITAGPLNPISRYCLANRFSIFVGKISYPLYLWHWPLISYPCIIYGYPDSEGELLRIGLVALSFILATLTYFFVEKPIRFGKTLKSFKIVTLIIFMVIIGTGGLMIYNEDGLPNRTSLAAYNAFNREFIERKAIKERDSISGYKYAPECPPKDTVANGGWNNCFFRDAKGKETIAIFGNSFAEHAYYGIADLNEQNGVNTFFIGGWHPDEFFLIPELAKDNKELFDISTKILNTILNKKDIKHVFIVARFYAETKSKETNRQEVDALQHYVNTLVKHNKIVHIVEENPYLPDDIKEYIPRPFSNKERLSMLRSRTEEMHNKIYPMLSTLKNVQLINTLDLWCPDENCVIYKGDIPIYNDATHLNLFGSKIQAEYLRPFIEKAY